MKKSELRKIIRGLITEQSYQASGHEMVGIPTLGGALQYQCGGFQNPDWDLLCCQSQPTGYLDNDGNGALFGWIGLTNPSSIACLNICNPNMGANSTPSLTSQQIINFVAQHGTLDIYNSNSPFPTVSSFWGIWDGLQSECNNWVNSPLLGCTDSTANNYDPTATVDDGSCITTSPCDTSTSSPCAIQWFQNPNAGWAAGWITNRDCSNYTWPANNLPVQALALMASAPYPQPGPYNNWNDIWDNANDAWSVSGPGSVSIGGPGSDKSKFIGKMSKGRYAECQKAACNC